MRQAQATAHAAVLPAALAMESDDVLGVLLTCATAFVTVCGALVVYSSRLAYLWAPRSLVVALGLATGGVLCFALVELLPEAQSALEDAMKAHLSRQDGEDDGPVSRFAEGYAALALAGAFAVGVAMVWTMDALCLYVAVPPKRVRTASRDQTMLTRHEGSVGSLHSLRVSSPTRATAARGQALVLPSTADELLYRTGTARVAAFAVQNIPEGLALCMATHHRQTLGVLFACAISLINLAQGMALAGLLTQAGGYRWRAVLWCALAALGLPLGGFLSWGVLLKTEIDSLSRGVFFGFTGGLLVAVCLTQVLTVCYNHKPPRGDNSPVTVSVLSGAVFLLGIRMLLAFVYV